MPQQGTARTAGIFNIQRFSTHDGPGIRTTVFLKGCPLSCWWCHNPESQSFQPDLFYYDDRCRHCVECISACPEDNIQDVNGVIVTGRACSRCGTCIDVCVAEARRFAGRRVTVAELLAEIEKDLVFFEESGGGVTLSGGEPAAQAEFCIEFLNACRERRIHTAIETCGLASPQIFLRLAAAADLVMFDVKLIDSEAHREFTGVGNERILQNLDALLANGRRVIVRIPMIPGCNDSRQELDRFAAFLSPRIVGVELLPFHRIGAEKYRRLGMPDRMAGAAEPGAAEIRRFRDALISSGLPVYVGGEA